MNTIFAFVRSQAIWILLLGLLQQATAQNSPIHSRPDSAKAVSRKDQWAKIDPADPQRLILTVIQQGLHWLALSHHEGLKAQVLQSSAQALGMQTKQGQQPKQKDQIRDLFIQTIQAITDFKGSDVKAELLSRTARLAIEAGDSGLTHGLLSSIQHVADSIQDPVYKAYALGELARSAAFIGDQPMASILLTQSQLSLADTIRQTLSRHRLVAMGQALDSLAHPGTLVQDSTWLAQAMQQLSVIEDKGVQTNILSRLFRIMALESDNNRRQRAYDQLLRMVHGLPSEGFKARLLNALVQTTVDINDQTTRRARLTQLKQEAQSLADKAAQRQVLMEIYSVALRVHDPQFNPNELNEIISQAFSSRQGTNPFSALFGLTSQSPASLRLRIITQVLGTMALVTAQLGDQPQANRLIQQTSQVANGIDIAPDVLSTLATTTAQDAAQPAAQPMALTLLRQAEQLAQDIDEPKKQIQTWGKLAGWAALTGDPDKARTLLKLGVQGALQLPKVVDRGYSIGALVQSFRQLTDTIKVRSLLEQVVRLVGSQPTDETKANAYAGILRILPTRSRQAVRLLDTDQTYALVSQSLLTIRAVNNAQAKLSVLTALVGVVGDLTPAQSYSLLTQLVLIANALEEPEKSRAIIEIIGGFGILARGAMLTGDQQQAQTLFNQAQHLWSTITQTRERGQAAFTLVEKKTQALAEIRNPAAFQRSLIQLRATVKAVEPYVNTWDRVIQVLIAQARQEANPQHARMLLTQALTLSRQAGLLPANAVLLSSLTQAGIGVFSQDQLKALLTQTLRAVDGLDNGTTKARELIALGRASAQRRPLAQANELIYPVLQAVKRIDNQGIKVYALNGLVQVDQRTGQKEPVPSLWQQVVAIANTLDDAEALAQARSTLDQVVPISGIFLPEGQVPSLTAQQQALQAANPSVRAEVLSTVAESMAYWTEWTLAQALPELVRPEHKIQLIQGMLTGWIRHHQIKKP